jgi:hypothetical protein
MGLRSVMVGSIFPDAPCAGELQPWPHQGGTKRRSLRSESRFRADLFSKRCSEVGAQRLLERQRPAVALSFSKHTSPRPYLPSGMPGL